MTYTSDTRLLVYRDGVGAHHLSHSGSPMTLCGFDVEWMTPREQPLPGTKPCPSCRAAWDEELYISPSMRDGQRINDSLWEFSCGCIEGFHPYHFYPCAQHRKKRRALWGWWRRSEVPGDE